LEEYEIPIACQYRDGLAEIVNLLCVDPEFNVFDQRIVALAVDVEPEERGVLLELRSWGGQSQARVSRIEDWFRAEEGDRCLFLVLLEWGKVFDLG
jgi:hypothetical protein